jgi:hypothetical protein
MLMTKSSRKGEGFRWGGTPDFSVRLSSMSSTARRELKLYPSPKSRRPSARRARAFAKHGQPNPAAQKARRKFLRAFPGGFADETYLAWERDYKWNAHLRWQEALGESSFRRLLYGRQFAEIARLATSIESRTNLLFSFEKMALRDAVRSPAGAQAFSNALFDLLHGGEPLDVRFDRWIGAVDGLPRRQTRVLTWPLITVFGFIAQPRTHFFFKPMVTREAARRLGVELPYAPRPSWRLYRGLLALVRKVRTDISDMRPRDMIDMQSFLWVQGSDEYPD